MSVDRFRRAHGRQSVLLCKKTPAALEPTYRTVSENQSWHGGAGISSSVPHVFNQALASSPVRCRPVS